MTQPIRRRGIDTGVVFRAAPGNSRCLMTSMRPRANSDFADRADFDRAYAANGYKANREESI